MSTPGELLEHLRRATQALVTTREERDQLRQRQREPIAIIGVGCRLPGGVDDLESFTALLQSERDAIVDMPADRFDVASIYDPSPDARGKSYTKQGAFLKSVDSFDGAFFGLAPREAEWLDPQHRLLLECSWEALENASIVPATVKGRRVGTYVGIGFADYAQRAWTFRPEEVEGYAFTGTGTSFSAGRLSYFLGLQGPAFALDTACSSSLVALHLACRSLRNGDCELALAGGVQVMLAAEGFMVLSRLRALAQNGGSKTFSAKADGYGRGEGCGMVVLKRLSDALRDGDPIRAVIRGSAINHDGASSGLTVPSGAAQRQVIDSALQDAALAASDVDYVECHGTGTILGDPIEVESLATAYGKDRVSPLRIGALKPSIGHLEAAAGIAGVLKLISSLEQQQLPASLHSSPPNPHLRWDELPLKVVRQREAWARSERSRRAGISAFGMSGTNAHVVLEEAPRPTTEDAPAAATLARSAELVVLSGKTQGALQANAAKLKAHLERHRELSLDDVAYSLATARTHHEERLAFAATGREQLVEALGAIAQGSIYSGSERGSGGNTPRRLAMLFTGQGAQTLGMGRGLHREWPTFREAFDQACAALDTHLPRPLKSVIWAQSGTDESQLLDETQFTQAALFAFEWALSAQWKALGLVPEWVAGHSIGEISAAAVAGLFSLDDAAKLVAARGRLMQALPSGGVMVSVEAPEEVVVKALKGFEAQVSLAAVNGPLSVVVAGAEKAVAEVVASLAASGVRTQPLKVSHAFHSPLMQPMLSAFEAVAQAVTYRKPFLPLVSNLTGAMAGAEIQSAAYWVKHVREAVRFSDGVKTLISQGANAFLEVGPKATLLGLVTAPEVARVASLRKGKSETEGFLQAVGALHVHGKAVTWKELFGSGAKTVALPTYAWQRQRHWLDAKAQGRAGKDTGHPLLGARVPSAAADATYENILSLQAQPWLNDHRVGTQVFVPGAGMVELVRAAAEDSYGGLPAEVRSFTLEAPLVIPESGGQRIQVVVREEDGRTHASLFSQRDNAPEGSEWTLHASGDVAVQQSSVEVEDLTALSARCPQDVPVAETYAAFAASGIAYGPRFRGLKSLRRGDGEAVGEVEIPDGLNVEGFGIHPALLDSAFHASHGVFGSNSKDDGTYLPFEFGKVAVHRGGLEAATVHIKTESLSADAFSADIRLLDAEGRVAAEVRGFRAKRTHVAALAQAQAVAASPEAIYIDEWREVAGLPPAPAQGHWCVLGPADSASKVAASLRDAGASAQSVLLKHAGEALASSPVDQLVWLAEGSDALALAAEGLTLTQLVGALPKSPRVWWVTRGANAVLESETGQPSLAAVWGLGRTVLQEKPEWNFGLVDFDAGHDVAAHLIKEAAATDGESQVAWRGDKRLASRLARVKAALTVPTASNWAMEATRKGTLDSLRLLPTPRQAPQAGEVEIEVKASGLNFRDALNALGMFPGNMGGELGKECSGLVIAVGAGVTALKPGDAVMALLDGAFRRYVTVDARLVSPMPKGISFEQAAAIPIVFLTALYALRDLAKLQRGEKLLLHAAAGGVGMAATQVAQWLGAEVFATASKPKWQSVREMGVQHVSNSRDLSFVDDFRRSAGTVDVVLNALTREFVDASLSLLGPGGRFLEMGKTDIREPAKVEAAFPGRNYRAFDLWDAGPAHIASMFADLVKGFEAGWLKPIALKVLPMARAEEGLRLLGQGQSTGKLILLTPPPVVPHDGTVLITGGLGALGLRVAKEFAHAGVPHLVLTGRRGLQTPGAQAAVEELERLGAQVTVAAIDVTDEKALKQMLAAVPTRWPLKGIVHAVGVLDDGLLDQQTSQRFAKVMAPKVEGALALRRLTQELRLDFFVLFSSVAGVFGSASQGAYAAANATLDALAARWKKEGCNAQSLAWGPWAEVGMASTMDKALQVRLAKQGVVALKPDEGMALLKEAMQRPEARLTVAPLDLKVMQKAFGDNVPPAFRGLVRGAAKGAKVAKGAWALELGAVPEANRLEAVAEGVRSEVARVLALSGPSAVPADKPLKELGLDSLMAVELRNALSKRAGATLPATLAFDYPTPGAISKYLLEKVLAVNQATSSAAPTAGRAPPKASDEPIAIVGVGCRFPGGADSPEALWELLEGGVDAVTEIPPERWDIGTWYDADVEAPGKTNSKWGGFVRGFENFEASFFGMTPAEAPTVDPQERMLLETTWEALERAAIAPNSLSGSRTGVYMGLSGNEYQVRVMSDAETVDAYAALGTTHSAMVGRLSYWLGLQGPNLPVDTACSSSLVALHLACQALRNGDINLALAGGANVLLSPESMVYFSRLRAMSPRGRCHAFSSDADGYVRAEGAGVVVLERLSDAKRNGRTVLGLIRGTAVNQDGRSNGPTAPRGPAQEAVIREALARGGIKPNSVDYLECHGTGTSLGDPIEVQAAAAVFGEERDPDAPLILGSIKTNIGHAEAAAGMAGLIKALLSLQQEKIPQSLHFNAPNPHIPWAQLPVKVAAQPLLWKRHGKPRRAGLSSFGYSGTNAHVVIEEAPWAEENAPAAPSRTPQLVFLTAKTGASLKDYAAKLQAHLEAHPGVALADVAFTLATARTHHEVRAALAVSTREGLLEGLASLARGSTAPGVERGEVSSSSASLVWLLTGQGAQTLGMGQGLHQEWPAFRDAFDAACAALDEHLPIPLKEVVWAQESSAQARLLDQTQFTQAALFAFEWALCAQWKAAGVTPQWVTGHSVGELVAAAFAEVFSLSDAAKLVAARGRLMQALPSGGMMISVEAPESEVSLALKGLEARVSLAAVNGAASVVVAGEADAVASLVETFKAKGWRTKQLKVSHAFHSPLMDPMLKDFEAVAQTINYRAPKVPLISNVSGKLAGAEVQSAAYWVKHVRETVRFADGLSTLSHLGATTFLEVGPKSTLLGLVTFPEAQLVSSLQRDRPEAMSWVQAAGALAVRGQALDWKVFNPSGGSRVDLPTYAWQRQRYWVEPKERTRSGKPTGHPLLGNRISTPGAAAAYDNVLSVEAQPWLGHHRVGGRVIIPGVGLAEMVRAAAEDKLKKPSEVIALVIQTPLVVPGRGGQRVQVVLRDEGQGLKASVFSQAASEGPEAEWVLHATADVVPQSQDILASHDMAALEARITEEVPVSEAYAAFESVGLQYGELFQGLRSLKRGGGEALARIAVSDKIDVKHYGIHPALLDAALHAVMGSVAQPAGRGESYLPFEFGRVVVHRTGLETARVHVRTEGTGGEVMSSDVVLLSDEGQMLAEVRGLRARKVNATVSPKIRVRMRGKIGLVPFDKLEEYKRLYGAEEV